VTDFLDLQHPAIGSQADLPQPRQVLQQTPNLEVVSIVDGCFSAQGPPLLVVLFDVRVLVIHVERGLHALLDDACATSAGGHSLSLQLARED
jgi:hypothetical protein